MQQFNWTIFFFEAIVTGSVYLDMLRTSILRAICQLSENESSYFQQDGAPPHYHRDIRSHHDEAGPRQWIGRRISVPPRPPDLNSPPPLLDFYLLGGGLPGGRGKS
jgi:hypothetical protein